METTAEIRGVHIVSHKAVMTMKVDTNAHTCLVCSKTDSAADARRLGWRYMCSGKTYNDNAAASTHLEWLEDP